MDLATITCPREATLPIIGEITLDVASSLLTEWLRAGLQGDTWSEPDAFVRDLLVERGAVPDPNNPPSGVRPIARETIDALSDDQIATISAAMLPIVLPYIRQSSTPTSDVQIDAAAVTLFEEAKAHVERDDARLAKQAEQLRRSVKPFCEFGATFALQEAIRKNTDDHLLKMAEIVRATSQLDRLATVVDAQKHHLGLSNTLGDAIATLGGTKSLYEAISEVLPSRTIGEAFRELQRQRDLASIDPTNFAGIARGSSDLASQQMRWARMVDEELRLGLQIHHLTAASSWKDPASLLFAEMHRTGYRSVADLALRGEIGAGAASDVLREYDLRGATTGELFAAVVATVTVLDDETTTDDARAALLHRVADVLRRISAYFSKEYEKAGLSGMAGLAIAMVSLGYVVADHQKLDLGSKLVDASANLKDAARSLRVNRVVQTRQSSIRYLHRATALRAGPDTHASQLRTVFPDQIVQVVEADNVWAKVEVFDYTSDRPATGWVARKLLRLSPPSVTYP